LLVAKANYGIMLTASLEKINKDINTFYTVHATLQDN
jgi:hypothetical protein